MKPRYAMLCLPLLFSGLCLAATTADVVVLVDESGSMNAYYSWINTVIAELDTQLVANGVTNNRYGLMAFGDKRDLSAGTSPHPHKIVVGGGDFGTAAQLATATSSLATDSGNTEDGWYAIQAALTQYTFRNDAALNIILITDEDRDNLLTTATYANTLAMLNQYNATLNAVVNAKFANSTDDALGINAVPEAYIADGSGGYTKEPGGYAYDGFEGTWVYDNDALGIHINDDPDTQDAIDDYVDMALATGGGGWNINILRSNDDDTIESFTKAFVDLKVGEIGHDLPGPDPDPDPDPNPNPTIPVPSSVLLGSLGVLLATRRR